MGAYKSLAELSFAAFNKGDFATAAKLARILERTWDQGEERGGYHALIHVNKELFEQVDDAMDRFIKPLLAYSQKASSVSDMDAAYQGYLNKLQLAETSLTEEIAGTSVTDSGLTYTVLRRGAGRHPRKGEIVCAFVTGFLETGEQIPSNLTEHAKGKPDCVRLGYSEPAGFDEGLSRLVVGDRAIFVVPAALAYGTKGVPGIIPTRANLIYFVEVVDVKTQDLSQITEKTLSEKGTRQSVDEFLALSEKGFPDVFTSESEINGFGYQLLRKGDSDNAILVLQSNVVAYPKSATAYDSLAEAYKSVGQKEKAIEYYRKALSIDPNMQSAIKALAELESR